jgi:hypothetical protein
LNQQMTSMPRFLAALVNLNGAGDAVRELKLST